MNSIKETCIDKCREEIARLNEQIIKDDAKLCALQGLKAQLYKSSYVGCIYDYAIFAKISLESRKIRSLSNYRKEERRDAIKDWEQTYQWEKTKLRRITSKYKSKNMLLNRRFM